MIDSFVNALTGIVVFIAFCLCVARCNGVEEIQFKPKPVNPSTLKDEAARVKGGPTKQYLLLYGSKNHAVGNGYSYQSEPSPTWGVRRK